MSVPVRRVRAVAEPVAGSAEGLSAILASPACVMTTAQRRAAATWRDYLALTKPRIISLLLITTVAAMFVAARGWPGTGLLLAVIVGGYLAAGGANTINMLYDRDIDGRMDRTASRPLVTQVISVRDAALFAAGQSVAAFFILWAAANLLTACLAMVGLLYYVVIYTAWLKRRTPQNIVIGGAAGAVPPLVGWAAVQGNLEPLAWVMFAVIFLWTPVHFWALAMMIKDDYARVGVPMLPVVNGDRRTALQIVLYAVLTAAASAVPALLGSASWVYVGAMVLVNAGLAHRVGALVRRADRPAARSLFKYSLMYLAALFFALAVDSAALASVRASASSATGVQAGAAASVQQGMP
jgi:protoheme IX farnesyltransferase